MSVSDFEVSQAGMSKIAGNGANAPVTSGLCVGYLYKIIEGINQCNTANRPISPRTDNKICKHLLFFMEFLYKESMHAQPRITKFADNTGRCVFHTLYAYHHTIKAVIFVTARSNSVAVS